jgi:uncharacterized membrane protein
MTAFVLTFSAVFVVLLMTLMLLMPLLVPAGLPLGVAVPEAHRGDPSVRRALARYRIGQVVAAAVAIAVAAVLAFTVPVAAAAVPQIVFIGVGVVFYLSARRGIIEAKRAGDWYADVPVRLSAEITAPSHHRPPVIWPALAAVLLAVAAAIGAAMYPYLPDPYAIHRDLAGAATAVAPKTPLVVFGPLVIGAVVAAILTLFSVLVTRAALRAAPGDDPAEGPALAAARRGVVAAMLSELSAVVAFGISAIEITGWTLPDTAAGTRVALIVMIALVAVVIGAAVRRSRRIAPRGAAHPRGGAEAPDDDRHWKGGIVYVNRDDPSLFVPKRFGLGLTINLGHPGGIAIVVLLALIAVGAIVAAVLGIRAR